MYKTLYYPSKETYEYQKRGKQWVYRVKGSKGDWEHLPEDRAKVLAKYFGNKSFIYFYDTTYVIGVLVVVSAIG